MYISKKQLLIAVFCFLAPLPGGLSGEDVAPTTSPAPAASPSAGPVAPSATSPTAAAPSGNIIYDDPTANSSANIVQVLPNSQQTMQTFTNVQTIAVQSDVFVIHWAHGAVTLLPKQFVLNVTINRRAVGATPPPASPSPPAHSSRATTEPAP